MEWDKKRLEETVFHTGSHQKIYTGDHLSLPPDCISSHNAENFIKNTVEMRESKEKRSAYEFNANIKVDGISVIPKDPGIILILPPNDYTPRQFYDLSSLIEDGLYVQGTVKKVDQASISAISLADENSNLAIETMLNQLGLPPEKDVGIVCSGYPGERAAFAVPLVAFKPERSLPNTVFPIEGTHILLPESSLQAVASKEEDNTPVKFRIKRKDVSRYPLNVESSAFICSHGNESSLIVFIPDIEAVAFRSREMPAQQSLSTNADRRAERPVTSPGSSRGQGNQGGRSSGDSRLGAGR